MEFKEIKGFEEFKGGRGFLDDFSGHETKTETANPEARWVVNS